MNKPRTNYGLDVVIFVLFVATAGSGLLLWLVVPGGRENQTVTLLGWTHHDWVDLHLIAGVSMLVGTTLHLMLHWDWIKCVARRLCGKLARQARIYFWLDSGMLLALGLIAASGLIAWLVLPGGGYRGGRNPAFAATWLGLSRHDWIALHGWAGLALMTLLITHLGLHWRWLVCSTRRYLLPHLRQTPAGANPWR